MRKLVTVISMAALAVTASTSAQAAKKEPVELQKCEASLGTIAVVEGSTKGWSDYGLGSPRELINALAIESGCFTPHNAASTGSADFLMNVIAGDSEEVDKSISTATSLATSGLVQSGAAGAVLSKVPMAGALFGAFGGLGGKKKRVAAGITLLSPTNGMSIASASGEVKKSSLTFGGATPWTAGANAAGYASSKDGKLLVEAFVIAFNSLSAQSAAIAATPKSMASPAAAGSTAAVDTIMRAAPSATGVEVRSLRAGTELKPTGERSGLFIEVEDNYGTKGWVSVEDLG
ncbi:MAG: SH3 domain-containing protein [Pontixanthobacter sp.]